MLGPAERALLDEALALGRASDAAARAGSPARCDDLLDDAGPVGVPIGLTDGGGVDLSLVPPFSTQ